METIFRSLHNVVPSHLADARLFDFAGLAPTGVPVEGGDTAFDTEPLPETVIPLRRVDAA